MTSKKSLVVRKNRTKILSLDRILTIPRKDDISQGAFVCLVGRSMSQHSTLEDTGPKCVRLPTCIHCNHQSTQGRHSRQWPHRKILQALHTIWSLSQLIKLCPYVTRQPHTKSKQMSLSIKLYLHQQAVS